MTHTFALYHPILLHVDLHLRSVHTVLGWLDRTDKKAVLFLPPPAYLSLSLLLPSQQSSEGVGDLTCPCLPWHDSDACHLPPWEETGDFCCTVPLPAMLGGRTSHALFCAYPSCFFHTMPFSAPFYSMCDTCSGAYPVAILLTITWEAGGGALYLSPMEQGGLEQLAYVPYPWHHAGMPSSCTFLPACHAFLPAPLPAQPMCLCLPYVPAIYATTFPGRRLSFPATPNLWETGMGQTYSLPPSLPSHACLAWPGGDRLVLALPACLPWQQGRWRLCLPSCLCCFLLLCGRKAGRGGAVDLSHLEKNNSKGERAGAGISSDLELKSSTALLFSCLTFSINGVGISGGRNMTSCVCNRQI